MYIALFPGPVVLWPPQRAQLCQSVSLPSLEWTGQSGVIPGHTFTFSITQSVAKEETFLNITESAPRPIQSSSCNVHYKHEGLKWFWLMNLCASMVICIRFAFCPMSANEPYFYLGRSYSADIVVSLLREEASPAGRKGKEGWGLGLGGWEVKERTKSSCGVNSGKGKGKGKFR